MSACLIDLEESAKGCQTFIVFVLPVCVCISACVCACTHSLVAHFANVFSVELFLLFCAFSLCLPLLQALSCVSAATAPPGGPRRIKVINIAYLQQWLLCSLPLTVSPSPSGYCCLAVIVAAFLPLSQAPKTLSHSPTC